MLIYDNIYSSSKLSISFKLALALNLLTFSFILTSSFEIILFNSDKLSTSEVIKLERDLTVEHLHHDINVKLFKLASIDTFLQVMNPVKETKQDDLNAIKRTSGNDTKVKEAMFEHSLKHIRKTYNDVISFIGYKLSIEDEIERNV